jgi:hypothetical protein
MRGPDEQEEFLEHGRFGEGEQSVRRVRLPPLVKVGFAFIGAGCFCIAAPVILRIGRDDGAPFLILGYIFCAILGVGFWVVQLVKTLMSSRRR